MNHKRILLIGAGLLALAACSEQPQTGGTAGKVDTPAWQGTSTAYDVPGWKAGDENAWKSQMNERVRGQDEYQRMGGAS